MYKLDEIDFRILEILKQDGRRTYSDIAEDVHLSRVAVRERILSMQEKGVIRGFAVQINSKVYNKNVSIFFDVEVEPNKIDSIARKLASQDDIAVVSLHSGTSGLHVHAYLDRVENLAEFMNDNFFSIDGIRNVHSHILIKNYKINVFLH